MDLTSITEAKIQVNRLILAALIMISVVGAVFFIAQCINFQEIRVSLEHSLMLSEEQKMLLKKELAQTTAKLLNAQELHNNAVQEEEQISGELNELKLTLKQTEELLSQAKNEKGALEGGLKKIKEDEVERVNKELISLKEKLRILESEINNLDETKLVLKIRLRSLRELRRRIRDFRREAYLNKVKAQKEIDRIELEKGNRGFVTKEGQAAVVNPAETIELEKIIIIKTQPAKKIEENRPR